MFTRTLVRDIKPGDLVKTFQDDYGGLLVVLCIKLFDYDSVVATVTFLNSDNKIVRTGGWIMLYKVTTEKKINNE